MRAVPGMPQSAEEASALVEETEEEMRWAREMEDSLAAAPTAGGEEHDEDELLAELQALSLSPSSSSSSSSVVAAAAAAGKGSAETKMAAGERKEEEGSKGTETRARDGAGDEVETAQSTGIKETKRKAVAC